MLHDIRKYSVLSLDIGSITRQLLDSIVHMVYNIQSTYYTYYTFPRRYFECSSCPPLRRSLPLPPRALPSPSFWSHCWSGWLPSAAWSRPEKEDTTTSRALREKKKKEPQLIHRDVILVIDSCPFYRGCLFSCARGIRIPTWVAVHGSRQVYGVVSRLSKCSTDFVLHTEEGKFHIAVHVVWALLSEARWIDI